MFNGNDRQRKAQRIQASIELRKKRQEQDWRKIAQYLKVFQDELLYEELDFPNFHSWAESIGISRSLAYDLAAIAASPHRAMLESLGISKARLLLPKLNDADEATAADLVNDIAELTWHDARQRLYGDDPMSHIFMVACPSCGTKLKASKSVTLEESH
jgi:hypothetical protein